MGAVIKLIIFAIVLGIVTYYVIMWNAKRKYWKSKSAEARYGKEFTEAKQRKQKERRKSFWTKVGYATLAICMGVVLLAILNKRGKGKK